MTARKNGVKRLLMYFVVLIGALFIGTLSYYFAKNNETIALTIDENEIVYINQGDSIILPISHTRASKSTTITVESSNSEIVSYNESVKSLTAGKGGVATINVTTSNKNFGPFKFDVFVGDGSIESPWYISSALQLSKIGQGLFKTTDTYEIINDLDLSSLYETGKYWTPITEFSGSIRGEGHIIANLKIESLAKNVGFIGVLSSNASIENIKFTNVNIYAANADYVGVIAGINNGFIGKVEIDGILKSAGATTYVGGIAGANVYNGTRPVINMVETNLEFVALGNIGGAVGLNQGGILFNVSAIVSDLASFDADNFTSSQTSTKQRFIKQYTTSADDISFAGVVNQNEAIIFGDPITGEFRQAAVKNVVLNVKHLTLLDAEPTLASKFALVAFNNVEKDGHEHRRLNEYKNITSVSFGTLPLFGTLSGAELVNVNAYPRNQFVQKTIADLGLSDIWSFNEKQGTFLLDMEASQEATGVADPGSVLTTHASVLGAIKNIVENPNRVFNYSIELGEEEDNVITGAQLLAELGIQNWQPIGSQETPYIGQFVVKGKTLVIDGLTITTTTSTSGQNALYGFFGFVSGKDTLIQNIELRNISIETEVSKTSYAGALAAYVSGATIKDITLDAISIKNATKAGFAVGQGDSIVINNVIVGKNKINTELEGYENNITDGTSVIRTLVYGGVIGSFSGNVSNTEVHEVKINVGRVSVDDTYVGGVAGTIASNSKLSHAYNYGAYILNESGFGYIGGVAGMLKTNSTVESSFTKGTINGIITTEDTNFAAGLVAVVEKEATVEKSFSEATTVRAKFVGGLVAINAGIITESYVSTGDYKGYSVGGMAYVNFGKVTHSYIINANLESDAKDSDYSVAGLVVYMPKDSSMEYVYSSASISRTGNANLYAETRSRIRYSGFEKFIDDIFNGAHFQRIANKMKSEKDGAGKITNYVVVNYGSAYVQTNFFAGKPGFIEATQEDAMGNTTTNPFRTAGFFDYTPTIWAFEDGQWPHLVRVVIDPTIVEEAE